MGHTTTTTDARELTATQPATTCTTDANGRAPTSRYATDARGTVRSASAGDADS